MSLIIDNSFKGVNQKKIEFIKNINLRGSYNERVAKLKNNAVVSDKKPSVVILGAGPAGLIRAIISIYNGNPTKLIEKHSEDAEGRDNAVALSEVTISMMKFCGIYQYLIENALIYPPAKAGYISVRLGDLEKAMKAILKELDPNCITYGSKVTAVSSESEKIGLEISSADGQKYKISDIDILVNAEGSRSKTNTLLGIKRVEVLPKLPAMVAIYKDSRPKIQNIGSFVKYVSKSIANLAVTVHYHALYLFKYAFSKKFRKQIKGGLILKTPGQNYLGCAFSKEINGRLRSLVDKVKEKRTLLNEASTEEEKKELNKELSKAEKKYNSFAKHWINLSLCSANIFSLVAATKGHYLSRAIHGKLDSFHQVEIGADHADNYCKKMNQSVVLLAGDASATVDPTTGLGCNTALQTSIDFVEYIFGCDEKIAIDKLVQRYSDKISERVKDIHRASKVARSAYGSD